MFRDYVIESLRGVVVCICILILIFTVKVFTGNGNERQHTTKPIKENQLRSGIGFRFGQ